MYILIGMDTAVGFIMYAFLYVILSLWMCRDLKEVTGWALNVSNTVQEVQAI